MRQLWQHSEPRQHIREGNTVCCTRVVGSNRDVDKDGRRMRARVCNYCSARSGLRAGWVESWALTNDRKIAIEITSKGGSPAATTESEEAECDERHRRSWFTKTIDRLTADTVVTGTNHAKLAPCPSVVGKSFHTKIHSYHHYHHHKS